MNAHPRSWLPLLACVALVAACQSEPSATKTEPAKPASPAKPAAPAATDAGKPAAKPVAAAKRAPRQEPLVGGPYATLLVAQAQFVDQELPNGKFVPMPGPAKLTILRETADGWTASVLEDPESNVFHKALPYAGGILTIAGNQAKLKTWHFANGAWQQQTLWSPKFGGKFDRLRDLEHADVDGDGKEELVIATHDQGVIAIVHPDESWRVEQIDQQPNTFVHEIEIGDVDGDGKPEIFATPSKPNKLDQKQAGEVSMYKRGADGAWAKSVVDAPGDTHAKEILAANVDGQGATELYIVWEGAVAKGGKLVRPVTIKEYRMKDGAWTSTVVTEVPDRLMRATGAADVNGDGSIDLVAGGLASGLWLVERGKSGWQKTQVDADSSGFEHPVLVADIDGNGTAEIYVASEDQGELRRYEWKNGKFEKTVIAKLEDGDITWNIQDAKL